MHSELQKISMEGKVAFVINIATGLVKIIMQYFYPWPSKILLKSKQLHAWIKDRMLINFHMSN